MSTTLNQPIIIDGQRRKIGRYLIVTLVATPVNFLLYAVLLGTTRWHATVCNIVAATAVTVPTYAVNRLWVWKSTGGIAWQIACYWLTTIVNVAVASGAVWMLELVQAPHLALVVAPLLVYTLLWLVRFVVLDRVLFTARGLPDPSGKFPQRSVETGRRSRLPR